MEERKNAKVCKGCEEVKPLTEFHKHASTKDGLRTKCKSCRNVEKEAWRSKNPDKVRNQNKVANRNQTLSGNRKRWYWENRDRLLETKRDNYSLEKQRDYQERNRGKVREWCANRRAKLAGATPSWADRGEMSYIHTLAAERGLVVDHIVPINSEYVCGLNTPDNLRCITNELNCKKGNRYWPDMAGGFKRWHRWT